jgi:hypothetical protein
LSRTALAFAWDAVTLYGEPLAGDGTDHVRVRLSQQELARRNRCSPSTVSWYLRRLGPVVVTRRDGLVFDRAALATLPTPTARVAPRTAAVERELLDSFARPTADGTRVELLAGSPGEPRPASLQDVAAQLGINRSSAFRHVAALERAGHLQRQGRRLYAVSTDHPTKEPTVDQHPHEPAAAVVGAVTPQQLLHLLDKVTELLGLVAGMANHLLAACTPATPAAHDSRFCGAQAAEDGELRAAVAADRGRGSSSESDLIECFDVEITSNQSNQRIADSRPSDKLRAETSRIDPDWSPDQLPQLLAPLLEECDRLDLPGVADAQRVVASLRPFVAEQIAGAARQMAADLRSGAPMRSPIAILMRKAEDRDPYYFRVARPQEPPPPAPRAIDELEEPVDAEAEAAVAQLDEDALAQLDEAVAAHVRGILGDHTSALESPATVAYWRPIVWRQHHQPTNAEGA